MYQTVSCFEPTDWNHWWSKRKPNWQISLASCPLFFLAVHFLSHCRQQRTVMYSSYWQQTSYFKMTKPTSTSKLAAMHVANLFSYHLSAPHGLSSQQMTDIGLNLLGRFLQNYLGSLDWTTWQQPRTICIRIWRLKDTKKFSLAQGISSWNGRITGKYLSSDWRIQSKFQVTDPHISLHLLWYCQYIRSKWKHSTFRLCFPRIYLTTHSIAYYADDFGETHSHDREFCQKCARKTLAFILKNWLFDDSPPLTASTTILKRADQPT